MAGAGSGSGYTSLKDVIDGGGAGISGAEFEGGLLSDVANALGIRPLGSRNIQEPVGQPMGIRSTAAPVARPAPAMRSPTDFQYSQPARSPDQFQYAPGSTTGQPLQSASLPMQARSPDQYQYPAGMTTGQPMQGAAMPPASHTASVAVSPRRDQINEFFSYVEADPHRLGVYESMPEAAQIQAFRDWQRGARF